MDEAISIAKTGRLEHSEARSKANHDHGFSSQRFREVLGHYPTGVTIITAIEAGGRPTGMSIGSFASASLDPPLVTFLANRDSSSFQKILRANSFCVNVLGVDQQSICRQFAAKGADKFTGISWRPALSGAPILEGVVAWIDCEIANVFDAGDHQLVLGRVRALDIATSDSPLVFLKGGYGGFVTGARRP